MSDQDIVPSFDSLGLAAPVLKAIKEVGYEQPSAIQQHSIPPLLEGRDLLGQAQTGTGKTAAFALPLLSRIDPKSKDVQLLVLAPTRELAIQVAEACQKYAHHLPGFHVLPIYGGQSYTIQLRALSRGVQVVVGTPGRIMDHMRRGSLKLDNLRALVLDEADEMLRMGFIDDVEWILEHTPEEHQMALFSATMPSEVKKIAEQHLVDPEIVKIQTKTSTNTSIRQRYWMVDGLHKLDALSRLLEVEQTDGTIIFVRTKTATEELAEKLTARGYAAAALHGDIQQKSRERIVEQLKSGAIDILVATDVVARGLDVPRISHVINYDIPHDTESYVHRIGRTGRAGRSGEAILFVARREMRMLRLIEKATKQPIEPLKLPSAKEVSDRRVELFKQRIHQTMAANDLAQFVELVSSVVSENDLDPIQVGAALALMANGDQPLWLDEKPQRESFSDREGRFSDDRGDRGKGKKRERDFADRGEGKRERAPRRNDDGDSETFRIEVGHVHGVTPREIVGAIANEAGIEGKYIGAIEIYDDFSTVDLPAGMPKSIFQHLKNTRVKQQKLSITKVEISDRLPVKKKKSFDKPATGKKKFK